MAGIDACIGVIGQCLVRLKHKQLELYCGEEIRIDEQWHL